MDVRSFSPSIDLRKRLRLLAAIGICLGAFSTQLHAQESPEDRLRAGLAALSQGLDEQAATSLSQLIAEEPQAACAAKAMCGAGQALVRLGRHLEALEFFEAAIARHDPSLRMTSLHVASALAAQSAGLCQRAIPHCEAALQEPDGARVRATIYPVLVRSLTGTGQFEAAWNRVQEAAGLENITQDDVLELALSVGLAAASANEHAVATAALRWYLDHSSHLQDSPHAAEGLAWAKALTATDPVAAAEALESLVSKHPQVSSAPQALHSAAAYWLQAQRPEAAAAALKRLQSNYPETERTAEQWASLGQTAELAGDHGLARLAKTHALQAPIGSNAASPRTAAEALIEAAQRHDTALWAAALGVLARSDDPVAVAKALTGLADAGLDQAIKEAAAELIHCPDQTHSVSSCRTASEFLAATGRWNLLAEQAVRFQDPTTLDEVTLKWIVEGLQRTGQLRVAYDWTKAVRAESTLNRDIEFALRTAELALQMDTRESAIVAIKKATDLATTPVFAARAQILQAESEIRQAAFDAKKFDAARQLLEKIARNPESDGTVAARADWLIGETYFMQGRMNEAIDAYRQVETHPGCQTFRPLALVQAGKCFERLGRWRDAALCYSAAVTQQDDQHAARVAQERLNAIQQPARERR